MDGDLLAEKSHDLNDEYVSRKPGIGHGSIRNKRRGDLVSPAGRPQESAPEFRPSKKRHFSKRQTQLEELAEALAEYNDTKKEAQLKQIKNQEKMAEDYRGVKSFLNRFTDKKKRRRTQKIANYRERGNEDTHGTGTDGGGAT